MCISCVCADIPEQADVAQLPRKKVVHEAAQRKDVTLFVVTLMLGHLHPDQLVIGSFSSAPFESQRSTLGKLDHAGLGFINPADGCPASVALL